jgi:YidC/Oxa1 family membrane protein insertase
MNNQQSPFLDRKGLYAVILIGVFFALWQWYMAKTYPPQKTAVVTKAAESSEAPAATANEAAIKKADTKESKSAMTAPEKTFSFDGKTLQFSISNIGMGLKNVILKNYTDRAGAPIHMGVSDSSALFEMQLNKTGQPVVFNVQEKAAGHYVGTAETDGMTIVREIVYNEARQAFESSIELKNTNENLAVDVLMAEKIHQPQSSSFLFPSYDHQDFFVVQDNKEENTVNFSSAKSDVRQDFVGVHVAAVSSQYFASAILDQSDLTPEMKVHADLGKSEATAKLIYRPAQAGNLKLSQTFFVGPKSIDVLEKIHPEFTKIINLGTYLGVLAKPMLLFMKSAYDWFSNWGVAIILLTLLVRLAVLPLYVMSTKSMKAMQKVQPLIQSLREKYKDDPMTMNKEMMALMKQHKANPLGGCLPMLLQIPIFFALFRVIGSSVELYQAPFMFWIQDLSLHDKFFVLPVLMGATMYFQQKLTPTTMDPAQAKIMAFMPIIFSVFMLYLPSGLTLYMFISGLFGVIQQKLMMGNTQVPAVKKG